MTIFISQESLQDLLIAEQSFFDYAYGRLKCVYFAEIEKLQQIVTGEHRELKVGDKGGNNDASIRQLRKALKTVMSQYTEETDYLNGIAVGLPINDSFDEDVKALIIGFHDIIDALPENIDGILTPKTLQQLDLKVRKISGVDLDTGEVILNFETAKPIEHLTVVTDEDQNVTPSDLFNIPVCSKAYEDFEENKEQYQFFQLELGDVVYVKFDTGIKGNQGKTKWYYVYVLSGSRDKQISEEAEEIFDESLLGEYTIKGFVEARFLKDTWSNGAMPMPDMYSQLKRMPQNATDHHINEIIINNYFEDVDVEILSRDRNLDNNKIITIEGRKTDKPNDISDYPKVGIGTPAYYRFCVHLLLLANHPAKTRDINYPLYPKPGLEMITPNHAEIATNIVDSYIEDPSTPLPSNSKEAQEVVYQTFVNALEQADVNAYNYVVAGKIQLEIRPETTDKPTYLWIPSRQFAESLWQACSRNYATNAGQTENVLDKLTKEAVETIFFERSWGYRFRVRLGATAGFIGGDFTGDIMIYRKDTEKSADTVLKLVFMGEIAGGIDVGIGGGYLIGAGRTSKYENKKGVGAIVGADFKAGLKFSALIECEVPITGADPISQCLGTAVYGSIAGASLLFPGAAPFAMRAAMENMNLDLWNYITKLKFYTGLYAQAYAGGNLSLTYGAEREPEGSKLKPNANSKQWQNGLTDSTPFFSADKLLGLFAGAAFQADANISGEMGVGVEVNISYPYDMADCYNEEHKVRVPQNISLTGFAEGQAGFSYALKVIFGVFRIDLTKFLPFLSIIGNPGVRGIGMKYEIAYDLVKDKSDKEITRDLDPNFDQFIRESEKKISFYTFTGSLDTYLGSATEVVFELDVGFEINEVLKGIRDPILSLNKLNQINLSDTTNALKSIAGFLSIFKKSSFYKRMEAPFINNLLKSKGFKTLDKNTQNGKAYAEAHIQRGASTRYGKVDMTRSANKKETGLSLQLYADIGYTLSDNSTWDLMKVMFVITKMELAINHADTLPTHKTWLEAEFEKLGLKAGEATVLSENAGTPELEAQKKYILSDLVDKVETIQTETGVSLETMLEKVSILETIMEMLDTVLDTSTRFIDNTLNTHLTAIASEKNLQVLSLFQGLLIDYIFEMENIQLKMHAELSVASINFKAKAGAGAKARFLTTIEGGIVVHSDLVADSWFYPNSLWNTEISGMWGALLVAMAGKDKETGSNKLIKLESTIPKPILPDQKELEKYVRKDGAIKIVLEEKKEDGMTTMQDITSNFGEEYMKPLLKHLFTKTK